jgi:hypothetical protein
VPASETITATESATVTVIRNGRRSEWTPAQALFVLITVLLVITSVFGNDMPADVRRAVSGLCGYIADLAAAGYFYDRPGMRPSGQVEFLDKGA